MANGLQLERQPLQCAAAGLPRMRRLFGALGCAPPPQRSLRLAAGAPSGIPNQLAAEKLCVQGLSKSGMPFVVLVANRHLVRGRDAEETKRFFTYVMDTIVAGCGPGGEETPARLVPRCGARSR